MNLMSMSGFRPNAVRAKAPKARLWWRLAVQFLVGLLAIPASAFTPPEDTAGPLTARIVGPGEVTETESALPVKVVVTNSGPYRIEGTVRLGVIDAWRVAPAPACPFSVEANAEATLDFTVAAGEGTLSALYPIHAYVEATAGNESFQLHPILILKTTLADAPKPAVTVPWQPVAIAPDSANGLWYRVMSRVAVHVTGEEPIVMPMGWRGSDPDSYASVMPAGTIDRGDARMAVGMHPPWRGGRDGTILIETPLTLPDQTPLRLRFAVAIRDNDVARNEPPSDGVTFRVRVLPFAAPDEQLGEVVFEQHTATKRWQDAEVDLDRFVGQAVRIQFEAHPGPDNDKTCDQAYWGEPTLIAGDPEARIVAPSGPMRELGVIERHGARYTVGVRPGARGLLDAEIHFTSGDTMLSFTGFQPQVLGIPLAEPHVLCPLVEAREEAGAGYKVRHAFRSWVGAFDLVGELWVEEGALKARFHLENTPAPIPWQVTRLEDLAAGPWNTEVQRVYAGHGNVLVHPEAFSLGFDGHRLATSFVGFDFANGMALLQASDVPPENLEVTPATRTYTLHVPGAQTVSYVPAKTSWEAALAYRAIDKREASGGVATVAGRFVFDLWGGGYAEQAAGLQKAFQYGLTDAMAVWHNWQRWGYDYRLPDIWPPNEKLGTTAEFKALADLCRQHCVIFAPHDNYIDFYPDADAYSYDHIAFNQEGAPVKGWLNEGREAQAYRWRPDRVGPFLEANLAQIRDGIAPTGFFIDVWSSIGPHDYWTRDGAFHTKKETRDTWGELFAWIRETLGDNAPQISESGHDQLIGWLDGAQTNHLRVDADAKDWTTWRIECADAERIPWMDAVHHDRFILHGAGYGSRYQGGLDADLHGMYSDDYVVTEVMTGHPAMVHTAFGRDVVRKYWLLHGLMRDLALRRIESVDFAGDDIHRQHIRWDNGTEVWVNRGDTDWPVDGHILPQYGFLAVGDAGEAAIERLDGVITEWSCGSESLYINARPLVSDRVPISVTGDVDGYRDGAFELTLNWNAERGTAEPMRIFAHFLDDTGAIQFQGDHESPKATTGWEGALTTSRTVRLPESARPGDTFELRAGLYDTVTSKRALITGATGGERSVPLGTLALKGTGATVTGIAWTPIARDTGPDPYLARLNPSGKPVDFGAVTTTGACRIARDTTGLTVRPLPDSPEFTVQIDWARLPWALPTPARVQAIGLDGHELDSEAVRMGGGAVVLTCKPDVYEYRLMQ